MIELLGKHSADSLVALGAASVGVGAKNEHSLHGDRTQATLLLDAARVAAQLPNLSPDAQILLVFRQDRYAFAVALLASWSRGYAVCLPPNQRGEVVSQLLSRGDVGALLHDTEVGGHISVPRILAEQADVVPLNSVRVAAPVAVAVMTSGTTGKSQVWKKTGEQLLSEVTELVHTFALHSGQHYAVTVPPNHLYGLLFGVLLPLATGSAFCRHTPLLPGELAATVKQINASVLVTVPAHLRAARALARGQLSSLRQVFSSAGPLPEQTARHFRAHHDKAITEIFGSTETGGIAWRVQDTAPAWTPFSEVRLGVTEDDLLWVRSPFTNVPTSGPHRGHFGFVTADRVKLLSDGCFEHLGRQDGVVKVGGQRVSIPAMEACLLKIPHLQDAAIVAVPEPARGHRLLAAVVGLPELEAACRAQLQAEFEHSTLPRRYLFLDVLPRESNGKLMRSRLLRLFGLSDEGVALSRQLQLGPVGDFAAGVDAELPRADEQIRAHVVIPQDYIAFSGHFEHYPVLAGAIQLQQLVLPLFRRVRPNSGQPQGFRQVKFTGRIEPGDGVDIVLTFKATECHFSLSKGDKVCSSGIVVFAQEPEAP